MKPHTASQQPEQAAGASQRRRARKQKSAKRKPVLRILFIIVIIMAVLTGGAYYYFTHATRTAYVVISLNNKALLAVDNEADAQLLLKQLRRKYSSEVLEVVTFDQGEFEILRQRDIGSLKILPAEEALNTLDKQVTVTLTGYAIFINRTPVMMLASKGDALLALSIAGGSEGIPTFKERVKIAPYNQRVSKNKHLIPVYSPDAAARELVHPPRQQYYTVLRGDNLGLIGQRHQVDVEQLKILNPELNQKYLQPGDQLRLPDITAPLTVVLR